MAGHYHNVDNLPKAMPVFPLSGVLVLPRGQLPLKDRNVVNYGIRGEERANRVLVTSPGKADGQSARRRRVALLWFCDDVFGRNKRELLPDGIGLSGVGEDKYPIPRYKVLDPPNRRFQQGLVAQKSQQVLRGFGTAERPKAFAASARENEGKQMIGHDGTTGKQVMMFAMKGQSKLDLNAAPRDGASWPGTSPA